MMDSIDKYFESRSSFIHIVTTRQSWSHLFEHSSILSPSNEDSHPKFFRYTVIQNCGYRSQQTSQSGSYKRIVVKLHRTFGTTNGSNAKSSSYALSPY